MTSAIDHEALKKAIHAASKWYAILQSQQASKQTKQDWQLWLQQNKYHRLAWDQVQEIQGAMSATPGTITSTTLRNTALSRRELLRRLGVVFVAIPTASIVWHIKPWQLDAQYETAVGEQRKIILDDGSLLMLNTNSKVDVGYTGATRSIYLHQGEVFVRTSSDIQTPSRSLIVITKHGSIEALGTQFTVRLTDTYSKVNVIQDTVYIKLTSGGQSENITAGHQSTFTDTNIASIRPSGMPGWINGNLTVVDQALKEVLAELSRYRVGWLWCSDEIANMSISGTFPLSDTDRALDVITHAFSLKQHQYTRSVTYLSSK